MVERFIPQQLWNDEFRFLKIRIKGKEPTADMKEWQKKNFKYNDTELLNHLLKGGNYGVIGGAGNLILIDSDSKEIDDICKTLPQTFTVKTGSPEEYKKHYFYIADNKVKPIRLSKEHIGDLGDVRSVGQYVVAPTSIHPSGGEYKVIKDIPIAKISEKFIRDVFKEYIDKTDSTEFKEFPIDTKKRDSPFIKNCNVPDYVLNNKMKGGTSKNWKLFPYVIDVLNARGVAQSVYEILAKKQGHDIGAVKGWVKKVKEGKLAKTSCSKMKEYIKRFHPELEEKICGNCLLHKKIKKREEKERELKKEEELKLKKIVQNYVGKKDLIEQVLKIQPIFYDKSKIWWMWETNEFKWKMVDETDILNLVNKLSMANTINSKEKNEILEAMKQESRLKIPKNIKPTWIQFRDVIVDIKTGEEFKASPEYFATNPIPWELHKKKYVETPIMDKIFEEWVGKNYVKTLYEILAYCLLPDYPIHRLFCFIGEGLNGKSKFLKLLTNFLGEENVTSTELDTLLTSRFEITRLHKKLVCQMGETNFSEINKTSIIKKLTGQDIIGFEYKNKNPFDSFNYAKIIIATNNLPTTTDKTIGFYRRWLIIDFPNKFSEEKDILEDIPEEEYESLALKSIIYLKDLLNNRKFHNEGTIEERERKYEEKSDPLEKFMKEFTDESDPNGNIPKWEFIKVLNEWLKENRFRAMADRTISKRMKEHNIEDGRVYVQWWDGDYETKKQVRAWIGIKWREKEEKKDR